VANALHTIDLPHLDPDLPAAPGRDDFLVVCVSCHSARYVLMQPYFGQRQWEGIVDKMAQSYGAPTDSEQRKSIVAYLVAIHGPNTTMKDSAVRDDEFGATPNLWPAPSDKAPWLKLPTGAQERAAALSRGAALFAVNCAGCHGTGGRGDGVIAPALFRKPKDLTASRFSTKLLSQVLWNGKPGTSMPSWRSLPQPDLVALAAYVESLHEPAPVANAAPGVLENGAKVFQQNCAPCHGEHGDGNGATAINLLPKPANFKLKQPDPNYLLQVLSDGIPGTAMPSWQNQISESDRRALSEFVRSLFDAED
jgi:mono/diheme cytochrome c family protein